MKKTSNNKQENTKTDKRVFNPKVMTPKSLPEMEMREKYFAEKKYPTEWMLFLNKEKDENFYVAFCKILAKYYEVLSDPEDYRLYCDKKNGEEHVYFDDFYPEYGIAKNINLGLELSYCKLACCLFQYLSDEPETCPACVFYGLSKGLYEYIHSDCDAVSLIWENSDLAVRARSKSE